MRNAATGLRHHHEQLHILLTEVRVVNAKDRSRSLVAEACPGVDPRWFPKRRMVEVSDLSAKVPCQDTCRPRRLPRNGAGSKRERTFCNCYLLSPW